MTMLSRVADRLYWMARYLERAEDAARLVGSYHLLVMDIPSGAEPGWDILLRILDAEPQFYQRYRVPNEQNVVKFLLADVDNPGSVASAIQSARENVRTTRDVLPEETWEKVNELHIFCKDLAERSVGRRSRYSFVKEVTGRCQMMQGMLVTTLSRDHSFRFSRIGHLLERCDMTTRVVDVAALELMQRDSEHAAIEPLLWNSVLQSLSMLAAYRRMVGPMVDGGAMADFVLKHTLQPRSVAFCLRAIKEDLRPLVNNEQALRIIERARRKLARFDGEKMTPEQIHKFIDDFQLLLSELHNAIVEAWFLPEQ